jgi:hypothetical protein
MSISEAQIRANQENSAKSIGPKTTEGNGVSSANVLKHGLTATVVLPEREEGGRAETTKTLHKARSA